MKRMDRVMQGTTSLYETSWICQVPSCHLHCLSLLLMRSWNNGFCGAGKLLHDSILHPFILLMTHSPISNADNSLKAPTHAENVDSGIPHLCDISSFKWKSCTENQHSGRKDLLCHVACFARECLSCKHLQADLSS